MWTMTVLKVVTWGHEPMLSHACETTTTICDGRRVGVVWRVVVMKFVVVGGETRVCSVSYWVGVKAFASARKAAS